jgi:hypothetical protein
VDTNIIKHCGGSVKLTRKHFLQVSLAAGAAVTLPACGSDDDDGDGAGGAGGTGTGTGGTGTGTGGTATGGTGGTATGGTGGTAGTGTGGTGGTAACDPESVAQTGDHMHTVTIPMADVEAGVEQIYTMQTTLGHTHMLTLTAQDFAALQENGSIMVTSTTDVQHSHVVTIECA